MRRVRHAVIGLVIALAVPFVAAPAAGAAPVRAADISSEEASLVVRGSVHQVQVLHAPAGVFAILFRDGRIVQVKTVDELGGVLFRNVEAGDGWGVWILQPPTVSIVRSGIHVRSETETPAPSFYSGQHLNEGFGYLTTRDGTQLSIDVVLPGPADQGPYPTVVEYSGYDPSSPTTGQPQYKLMMPANGYAWVGVNIRGTGCSGGAFNYFENLQSLDGYDTIETIAAQPWSTGHVGMVGISYAGISQLFVARSQPPHLDAITPVSVIDDTWRGTLYPGGIFNNGFALNWARERVEQNKWPNPNAPGWVMERINGGDATCADNMLLRGQNVDQIDQIAKHPNPSPALDPEFTYDFPRGSDSLAPQAFVDQIRSKVFIAGAWQDEQTGGHWANMLDRFAPGVLVRAEGQNGTHVDSLDPQVAFDTLEFLDLYVGKRVPQVSAGVRAFSPVLWSAITGISGLTMPPDRFTGKTFGQALAAYQQEPVVKILWETGNADGFAPGSLVARAQSGYAAWPIPGTTEKRWYLHSGGTLTRSKPTGAEPTDSYHPNAAARPGGSLPSGNVWNATPPYVWAPVVDGASLAYLSDPLTKTTSMAGTGGVDLWISSTGTDSDLQVTLSEVLPNGQERYVQNGWLRLSHRRIDDARSTDLNPFHSDEAADMKPLTPGRLVKARVALFPFAHQFRAGSRIRVTVQAPGGDRPEWRFDSPTSDGSLTNVIAHDADHPSRIVLPIIAGPDLGASAAPCPSLRAQPCRAYVAPKA